MGNKISTGIPYNYRGTLINPLEICIPKPEVRKLMIKDGFIFDEDNENEITVYCQLPSHLKFYIYDSCHYSYVNFYDNNMKLVGQSILSDNNYLKYVYYPYTELEKDYHGKFLTPSDERDNELIFKFPEKVKQYKVLYDKYRMMLEDFSYNENVDDFDFSSEKTTLVNKYKSFEEDVRYFLTDPSYLAIPDKLKLKIQNI